MGLHYMNTVKKVYGGLRKLGVNVDFLDMEESLSGYRIVFAPMLYLFRAGIEEKIRNFRGRRRHLCDDILVGSCG